MSGFLRGNEPPDPIGVAITDFSVAVARGKDGPSNRNIRARDIPPAIVLGELNGERLTSDLFGPPNMRGSGLDWPPSARVSADNGSARFPIAFAWSLLEHNALEQWRWHPATNRAVTCEPSEAIAVTLRAAIDGFVLGSDRSEATVVVPNSLDAEAQDSLLRAIRVRHGIPVQLLWRPIAAALAWVDRYGAAVLKNVQTKKLNQYEAVGQLSVVHLGLDGFEATQLELIPWMYEGRWLLLPARRLPELPSLISEGVQWAEAIATDCTKGLNDPASASWNLLWTTGWLAHVVAGVRGHAPAHEASLNLHDPKAINLGVSSVQRVCGEIVNGTGGRSDAPLTKMRQSFAPLLGPFRSPGRVSSSLESGFSGWLDKLRGIGQSAAPLLGVIGTGAFAAIPVKGQTLSEYVAHRGSLGISTPMKIIDSDSMVLAKGAAIHAECLLHQVPTYLDVLPKLELLVIRSGEPVFDDILRVTTPYVLGGKESVFDPRDLGLRVRREEQSLTLTVWREGYEFVREVFAEFPRAVPADTPVGLKIRITPGQGNPRIEVKPSNSAAFGGRRVYLDWGRATDTGQGKAEALDAVPRTNPPLERRVASLASWKGGWWQSKSVKRLIDGFMSDFNKMSASMVEARLSSMLTALREKDPEYSRSAIPQHATAVSSEGKLHPLADGNTLLQNFIAALDGMLYSRRLAQCQEVITRTLGYCSANSPNLTRRLSESLDDPKNISADLLVAIGNCLRSPIDIARYSEAMLANLQQAKPRAPSNWMRSLCRLLQYRDDAAAQMQSRVCEKLSHCCLPFMREQIRAGKASMKYRHASLCIVYLLRRRRYDDTYLNPNGELASSIKTTFREAVKRFTSGRLDAVGGFVNLPHITQLMIDYVDRRGKGRLLGGPEDD